MIGSSAEQCVIQSVCYLTTVDFILSSSCMLSFTKQKFSKEPLRRTLELCCKWNCLHIIADVMLIFTRRWWDSNDHTQTCTSCAAYAKGMLTCSITIGVSFPVELVCCVHPYAANMHSISNVIENGRFFNETAPFQVPHILVMHKGHICPQCSHCKHARQSMTHCRLNMSTSVRNP